MELMDCGRLPLGVVKAKVRLAFSHAFFSGRVSAHFSDADNPPPPHWLCVSDPSDQ